MTLSWKDCSRGGPAKSVSELRIGKITVTVYRHMDSDPDEWHLTVIALGIHHVRMDDVRGRPIEEAQHRALQYAWRHVDAIMEAFEDLGVVVSSLQHASQKRRMEAAEKRIQICVRALKRIARDPEKQGALALEALTELSEPTDEPSDA
jgi:hypothetical protein